MRKLSNYAFIFSFTHGGAIYTALMQVYIEFALAENFCMDFVLLSCAKLLTKNLCSYKRIACASALGACFAVVFPLFGLGGALAILVKVASGLALAAAAARFKTFKGYIKFAAAFLGISFVLGGALIAVFSAAGISYNGASGYMLSSVPVGIPLFCALVLFFVCRFIARKIAVKFSAKTMRCVIFVGEKSVEEQGFYDSGNRVYYKGQPVSVISAAAASALVDIEELKESVSVHTVTGSKKIKVFTADKLLIYNGQDEHTIKCVKIGISPRTINRAVLHPDLAEES